ASATFPPPGRNSPHPAGKPIHKTSMGKQFEPLGIEINPQRVGVLLTDHIGDTLRLFCFYTNATVSQVDVPADENRENLSALFVTLSMEETCSSFILDEVVQGRLYVKS